MTPPRVVWDPRKPNKEPADRGQNTGLFRAACPFCGHPVSGRTEAALVENIIAHAQRPEGAGQE